MARTTVIFAIDFAQDAQVFAQMCALAAQAGIPMQVGVGASASAHAVAAPAPQESKRKVRDYSNLPAAEDVTVTVKRLDATHMDVPYHRGAVAKALSRHLPKRERDAEYEREDVYKSDYTGKDGVFHAAGSHKHGAHKCTQEDLDKFFGDCDSMELTIAAAEIQGERDKAVARAERKGH
jgi:hypothetical protein